jgi:hypothetical protein
VRVQVNYWPSLVEKTDEGVSTKHTESKQMIQGQRVKEDYPQRAIDDFQQAGDRIRLFTPAQYGPTFFCTGQCNVGFLCGVISLCQLWIHIY